MAQPVGLQGDEALEVEERLRSALAGQGQQLVTPARRSASRPARPSAARPRRLPGQISRRLIGVITASPSLRASWKDRASKRSSWRRITASRSEPSAGSLRAGGQGLVAQRRPHRRRQVCTDKLERLRHHLFSPPAGGAWLPPTRAEAALRSPYGAPVGASPLLSDPEDAPRALVPGPPGTGLLTRARTSV